MGKKIAFTVLILLTSTCCYAAPPEIVPPPPINPNSLRPDIEKRLSRFNRGDFPRSDNQVRVDVFYEKIDRNIEEFAKWASNVGPAYLGTINIQIHFVFSKNYIKTPEIKTPYLNEYGATFDYKGNLAKKGGIYKFPKARIAYRQYVWKVSLDEAPGAISAVLEKTGLKY